MQEPLDTDVVIVGAGVVGCAIARELSRFDLRVTLLEAGADVGAGTSKANTALLHTGFDAKPGTLEARLVARGYDLLGEYAGRVGISLERTGALLVAWNDEQVAEFPGIAERARANGYTELREVRVEELYRREPHLGPGACGALEVPGEGLVCPFTTPLAYATEAVLAGCDLRRSTPVTAVERLDGGGFRLSIPGGTIAAGYLVNSAGLRSDELDRMLGHDGFTVTPRRGELIVFDKLARPLVDHIVLAVPTKVTKGVLIAPTVFGNVMLGPTAEDVDSKEATGSTERGLAYLRSEGARIMPELLEHEVTAVYAGLRAATEHSDYQLSIHAPEGYACVGGIRSTGLTASMGIAEHVRAELEAAGLRLEPKAGEPPELRMPNIGELGARPHEEGELIRRDPEYGRVVCFCERVTRGEIRDALGATVAAADLDGLRRRTRAHMGRCQGFFCGAELAELLPDAPAGAGGATSGRAGGATTAGRAGRAAGAGRAGRATTVGVVVVGGGPAGLAAAVELRRRGVEDVLVLDRELEAGGIPRHARHQGFGLRDLRRPLSGPAYARRYVELAERAGVELRTETMLTGWSPDGPLELTGPAGRETLEPGAVILATGCRERPRSARLVPGDRPDGVMTTGTLQQLVYLKRRSPGRRALIVGAEHVSFSALLTLAHGGASAVGMVTELPHHQSLAAFRLGAAARWRTPLWTRTAVTAIHGRPRVEEVELTDLDSGASRLVECDTVVFTADWIPDHELAVMAGLEMDPGTRGPSVDAALRTSRPGVFAAGNLLHGAETADIAALSGRHAAAAAPDWLAAGAQAGAAAGAESPGAWPDARVPIFCDPPLHWISPNVVVPGAGAPPRERFALRSLTFETRPRVRVEQVGRVLWEGRLGRLVPGRSARLPHGWTAAVDPGGGTVRVRLAPRG